MIISEAYHSYYDELLQDVRVGNKRASSTIMWDCHSAAFTYETESYLRFDYFRKKVQTRMVKDALHGQIVHNDDIKRVTVSEQYVEDGDIKQKVTATSFAECWMLTWNCNKVCFEIVNQEIGQ